MMASWISPRMSTPSAANSRWPPRPHGDEARALAERLTAPLESAARLTMLNVLSAATDEITRELAPGSVDVRLRGLDPDFLVTLPPADTGGHAEAGRARRAASGPGCRRG